MPDPLRPHLLLRTILFACAAVVVWAASPVATAQSFAELSGVEQSILRPLAGDWDVMNATRKKKWRELAARYPSLSTDEQQRISTRMHGWARMSPDDRRAARDQFREITGPQGARPEAREQIKKQWQEYRNLPSEERKRLVDEARRRPQPTARTVEAVKRSGTPPFPTQPSVVPLPTRPSP